MSGIYTLLSGSKGQQRRMEATANNLANVNTPGYKGDKAIFREYVSDIMGQDLESEEELFANHEFLHPFAKGGDSHLITDDVVSNMGEGRQRKTGNPLDLAITGKGFFTVDTPMGRRYTRGGNFSLDNRGNLVDKEGNRVMGSKGHINIKGGKDVIFGDDGTVHVDGKELDTLLVTSFPNESKLSKMGSTYWSPSNSNVKQEKADNFVIHQGTLEGSNVNSVNEMVNLITINREFEATHKAIRTLDGLDEKSISLAQV